MDQSKNGSIILLLTFEEPSHTFAAMLLARCGTSTTQRHSCRSPPAPAAPRIRVVSFMECFAKGCCPEFSVISLGSHSSMAGTRKTTEVPAVHFPTYNRISLITRRGSIHREWARLGSLVSWSSACSSISGNDPSVSAPKHSYGKLDVFAKYTVGDR